MRFKVDAVAVTLFSLFILFWSPIQGSAQAALPIPKLSATAEIPDAPLPEAADQQSSSGQSQPTRSQSGKQAAPQQAPGQPAPAGDSTKKHKPLPQPKRILGLMPNYRAVSAGVLPPPPTPKQAFKIATLNSFDYSSGVFVGITSLLAEGSDDHPQLGKGVPGFWRYYWRGFVDKADGNYWVIWALPSVTHEDERYYSMGEGGIMKRGIYAASRVLITPNYHGKNTFNASEVFGRGISQAISLTYYPSADQNVGPIMEKYGYAIGRDALTNVFREFWPDIDAHVLHHHRSQQ